jgi:hypothetical protein
MITLSILLIMALAIILAIAVFGGFGIILFGDVIIAMAVLGMFIKGIVGKTKDKK